MVEMDMLCGYYIFTVIMLYIHQFSGKLSLVVIIDQSYSPSDFPLLTPFLLYQFLSDKVAERFRTIRVILIFYQAVELFQKVFINRHTESNQSCHAQLLLVLRF